MWNIHSDTDGDRSMSTLRVDTITNAAGTVTVPVADLRKVAFANMYYSVNDAAGSLTISSTAGTGAKMQFNKAGPSQNITVNTGTSTWTHTYTGTYRIFCAYRQGSGGDIWTVLAVTKGGDTVAVGISARTGSEDSHNENYTVIYTVDSTEATYQLQQWTATTTKTVSSDFAGKPTWTNYDTLCGGTTGDNGRMVDYFIERLGD
jgi:hypothetical protein